MAPVLGPIANFFGVTTSTAIGLLALLLLVVLSIQLSVSISGLQQQNRRLAEEIAFLTIREPAHSMTYRPQNSETLSANNVLVIVPAFNEENNVGQVLNHLIQDGYEVLLVDDGSADNTSSIAIEAGTRVMTLPFNLGVGGALRAGFRYASKREFQAVIQVDADGQHLTSEIPKLIAMANQSETHLVLGSRFSSPETEMNVGKIRRMVMKMLARSASKATRTNITDATSGFRLIRQPLLAQFSDVFPVNYLGDTYEALVAAGRAEYRVCEIPTAMHERQSGKSSASALQAITFTSKALVVALLRVHSRIRVFGKLENDNDVVGR